MIMSRKDLAKAMVAAVERLRVGQETSVTLDTRYREQFIVIRSVEGNVETFQMEFYGSPTIPLEAASRLILRSALLHLASIKPALSVESIAIAASEITAPKVNASIFSKIKIEGATETILLATVSSFDPLSNNFKILVNGKVGDQIVADSVTEFHLPQGIQFPEGYIQTHGPEQVAEILKAYDEPAFRVSSYGYKCDANGNELPIALFWIDPDAEYLKGHFKKTIALRLVELGEIGAQSALVMLIARGHIDGVKMLGFYRVWAELLEKHPKKQTGIIPGDTLQINLFEGKRTIETNPDPDLKGCYLTVKGECPILLNGKEIGFSGGESWLMARQKK
jgi:hypothetical protein